MARVHTSRTHASRVLTVLAAVALLVALIIPVGADDVIELVPQPVSDPASVHTDIGTSELSDLWFVELSTAPTSDGTSLADARAAKDAFRRAAAAKGIGFVERFAYDDLFNGLSIQADTATAFALARVAGVKAIWPVITESLPQQSGSGEVIDLSTALAQTGADYVQQTMGLTGLDVRVAIMDTGVDYHHPDLGGCFGDGCRVSKGWDFVGSAYNADSTSPAYSPTPVPDNDPDDCNGHGTHVAGIVGANGAVTGVAPGVTFGAYRVFGCAGSTTADIMLAAMERALADKMHVLNMSIGSAFQWPQYPTSVGADRLVKKHGIVVVASIGNSGTSGLYSAGSPGLGENVIGVASFDNSHITSRYFTATPDGRKFAFAQAAASPAAPTSGSVLLARTGTASSTADACAPLPTGSLAGKVALIRRGSCTFVAKAATAQAAGAAGVVIYNNVLGLQSITVAGGPPITIPVVSVSKGDGELLDARIATGATSLTWTGGTATLPNETSGLVSSFSSYGLSPDLSLKPDLGAPGGLIRSTLPLESGAYGVLSGTSMSSPHVAGAAALLIEASPKSVRELGVGRVRDILQNSAEPHGWWSNPALGFDQVHRQGAGMLNIRAAIEADLEITPGKLGLGESQGGAATRRLTLQSRPGTGKTITYTLSHQPALATGPQVGNTATNSYGFGVFSASAAVTFSAASVTVKNNESATVDVTITANAGLPDRSQYGGYVVVSGSDGSTYRVPYAGVKGDYQATPILTGLRSPGRLVQYVLSSGAIVPSYSNTSISTYAFSMSPKANPGTVGPATFLDVPYYLVHLDHQVRRVTFNAFTTGGAPLGEAMSFDYFGRNSTPNGFFAFAWDGTVTNGGVETTLASGDYVVRITVLKALGDTATAGHTETFTFTSVKIARP